MKTLYWVLIIIAVVAVVAILTNVAIKKEWFKTDEQKIKDAVKASDKIEVVDKVKELNELANDANTKVLEMAGKTGPNNLTLTNMPSPQASTEDYALTDEFLLQGSSY